MRRTDQKDRKGESHGDDPDRRQWRELENRVLMLEKTMEAKGHHIHQLEGIIHTIDNAAGRRQKEIHQVAQSVRALALRLDQPLRKQSLQRLILPMMKNEIIQNTHKVEKKMHEFEEDLMITKQKLHGLGDWVKGEKQSKIKEVREKEDEEKLVDNTTPYAHMFHIQGNNITHKGSDWHQVLFNVGRERKFTFSAHITRTLKGQIIIGVVDRLTQASQKFSHNSGNAVSYCGGPGYILYGHSRGCQCTRTGIKLKVGMTVQVELDNGAVTFTFHQDLSTKKFQQSCDILHQPHREFVPYFQMEDKDDSVRWSIKWYA